MIPDELYMHRAFELALLGTGTVSPNPLVGCVIVHDNQVIGEGWHRQYGGPHAEVNAIDSVQDKSLLSASTVYVNLEPCSHFGKTPPCVDLLIRHKVRRVVMCNLDSNPLVAGQGLRKMEDAGIDVTLHVLGNEGRTLNRRFFTFYEKVRPYITLKWAQTSDGFIAHSNFDSKWISNEFSRQWVHRWRSEEDAVLVGTRTASHDNPYLNVRDWSGRNPVRIVIDRFLRLPETLHLFDGSQITVCYNLLKHEEHPHLIFVRLEEENFLTQLLADLNKRKVQSLLVEGGATTLNLFIDSGLWDEARIFTSSRSYGEGIAAPHLSGKREGLRQLFSDELKIVLHGENKHR